ncbi:MAG: NYN domain-containing protein [Dehalococcoidia bacterium]|nr:NYN domain-containing protein [Dehalococcoidia bacterium]
MAEAQIAVLIDFENVGLGSVQPLFDQLSDLGRVIVRRAYADWSKASSKRDQVLQLGIEPIHHFQGSTNKNSSDISLAIDAVDLLYRSPVDTFVIVSSDSDFLALVMKLRASGKVVIGAGRRDVASKTLIASCDRFIFLGEEEKPQEQPQPEGSRAPRRVAPPKAEGTLTSAQQAEAREQATLLLLRALQATIDPDGQVSGSRLYQTMTRIDPSFNFRALGHSTFTHFLQATDDVRVIRRPQGDVLVELKSQSEHTDEQLSTQHDGAEPAPLDRWDVAMDAAWESRAQDLKRNAVSGPWAAEQAAKILGVPTLKASAYPTLQSLLDASPYLSERWERDGNVLTRRRDSRRALPSSDVPSSLEDTPASAF